MSTVEAPPGAGTEVPPGAMPTGAAPADAMPPGATPAGAAPTGAMPPGAMQLPPLDREGLRTLLGFARAHRRAFFVGLVLSFVGAATALAQPLAAREVLGNVAQDEPLLTPILLLVALVLAGGVLGLVQLFVLERAGERVVLGLRLTLVRRLLRLRMKEYDTRSAGELLSVVAADTTLLRAVLTSRVLDAASSIVLLVGAIGFMAWLDWVQLLSVLAVLAVVGLGVIPALKKLKTVTTAAQDRLGTMTSSLDRALGAVRMVKANVAEDRESGRIGRWARGAYDEGVRSVKLDAIVGVAGGLAVQVSFLVVLGVGGVRVANGSLSPADLVAFLLYILYLAPPLVIIVQAVAQLQIASAAAQRIMAVNDMETETRPGGASLLVGAAVDDDPTDAGRTSHAGGTVPTRWDRDGGPPSVIFDTVRFGYREGVPVLRDVSFQVPRGAKAALVGPSGVGKTTIVALLERFYEPESGRILLGGRDLTDFPLDELRRQIGYVEQDAPVLAGTLRENLLYTAPATSDDELNAVVEASRLGDLVRRLPHGLDTEVGDRGTQLSGGERQRVAVGRLLLSRPRLVLLDEATSQLDSVNEAALRAAIDELALGCTMIVVAHRLSTVAASDMIVLLEGGGVRRVGRHDQLLADDALYQDLARGQLLQGDTAVAHANGDPGNGDHGTNGHDDAPAPPPITAVGP